MRFPRTRSECVGPLWEVIKYKESYFLVLEADQCISHHTLVPGSRLHSAVTPFQRGCKLLPAHCFTPLLSQGKINCRAMKIPSVVHTRTEGLLLSLRVTFTYLRSAVTSCLTLLTLSQLVFDPPGGLLPPPTCP